MRNIRVADPRDRIVERPHSRASLRPSRLTNWLATIPILLVVPVLLVPLVLAGAESKPRIVVEPSEAPPGRPIHVKGSGFPPRAAGILTLDAGTTPIATYIAKPEGEFKVTLAIPADLALGDHQIVARPAAGSDSLAAATFTVAARQGQPAAASPAPTPSPAPLASAPPTPSLTPAPIATVVATPAPMSTPSPNMTHSHAPAVTPASTPTPASAPNTIGLCSSQVHDQYIVTGPNGNAYPGWHPQRDGSGCHFGHDHGSDPSYFSAAAVYQPTFGYLNALSGMDEPHTGFKIFLLTEADGTEWLWTVHLGSSGYGRVCQRFHSVEVAVADASGTLLANLRWMGDFGRSEDVGTLSSFHPDACPDQAQAARDDGSTGARQLSVGRIGEFSNQYEPWRVDLHQIALGLSGNITFNTNSAMTTCNDVNCNSISPTLHRGGGAYRIVQEADFILDGATIGSFTTDDLARSLGGLVPQFIGSDVVLSLDHSCSPTPCNWWPGTDPNIVDYRSRSNSLQAADGKGDLGAYNIDDMLQLGN